MVHDSASQYMTTVYDSCVLQYMTVTEFTWGVRKGVEGYYRFCNL